MKKTFLLALVFISVLGTKVFAQMPLEQWAHNHPEASKALGEWVKAHPQDAKYMFEWDGAHPLKSQEFVNWCIAHPHEDLMLFYNQHRAWPYLEGLVTTHKMATEEFMIWCRNHGPAAKALMAHSGGLKWAGEHLYKTYWNLETPGKH